MNDSIRPKIREFAEAMLDEKRFEQGDCFSYPREKSLLGDHLHTHFSTYLRPSLQLGGVEITLTKQESALLLDAFRRRRQAEEEKVLDAFVIPAAPDPDAADRAEYERLKAKFGSDLL